VSATLLQVHPGQLWADNDPRAQGRTLEVVALVRSRGDLGDRWSRSPRYAYCIVASDREGTRQSGALQPTWIALSRFRPRRNGYRLVREAPGVAEPGTVLVVRPVTRSESLAFIRSRHFHPLRPGAVFRLGVWAEEELVGVAIVGHPQAHVSRDRCCAEVLRVCWDGAHPGAVVHLYRAIGEAARALGYTSLITYGEHGEASPELLAAGWTPQGLLCVLRHPDDPSPAAQRLASRWLWAVKGAQGGVEDVTDQDNQREGDDDAEA
jgi:hypothetical protein